MKLISLEQPSGSPAIQDQGSFGGLFFSGSHSWIWHTWTSPLPWAVAPFFTSQQWQNKQELHFLGQGISKGGWFCLLWAGCPSLGAHREVWEPLCSHQALSQPLPWFCALLSTFPPSSQRAGGNSSSKEIRRLWIRVCIPYQVPRAQKLSAVSYSHLFLVRHPLMRIGSDRRGGRRKLHKQNKSVIKFLLQMSRSGLGCYSSPFWHILDRSSRNSLPNEAQKAG